MRRSRPFSGPSDRAGRSRPAAPCNITLAVVLALCSAVPARAQGVVGRVVDVEGDTAVADVAVTLADSTDAARRTVVTDMTGAFAIPVAAAGRYRLRTEHVAYRPVVTRPFTVAFGDIVEVKIRVSRRTFDLEPLVVVGRRTVDVPYLRDYYDRVEIHRKAGRGRILTREELERLEGFTVRDVLRRERPFKDRRGRTCTPVFYWNGFAVEAEHIPVSNVEGIELYRSRENMTFYNGRGCGVVLVWNRPLREGEGRPHLAGQGPGRDVFRLGYGVGVSNPGTDVLSLNAMLEAEFMPIDRVGLRAEMLFEQDGSALFLALGGVKLYPLGGPVRPYLLATAGVTMELDQPEGAFGFGMGAEVRDGGVPLFVEFRGFLWPRIKDYSVALIGLRF